MGSRVTGEFEVKVIPQKADNAEAEKAGLGRMSIDKQFHGALEAASAGEMLSVMSEVKGSGVYVAIEKVTGKLEGRSGSFVLHHRGTMTRGVPELSVRVAPDSGTGELAGISGEMTIEVTGGKHLYEFEYLLGEAASA